MEGELSVTRRRWFSGLAIFFAIVFGVALFGWIGLLFGWFSNEDGGIHRVHNVGGSGVAIGLLVAGALVALAWKRRASALLQQIAAVGLGFALAALLAADPLPALFLVLAAIPVIVLLAVGRGWRSFLSFDGPADPYMLAVTVVSIPFWLAYSLAMAHQERIGLPSDPHIQMHHWTSMAAMAIAIVLVAGLSSFRPAGWEWTGVFAGAGAVVYGVASVVFARFPGSSVPYPGGEGVVWGLAAIVWGVAFAVLTRFRASGAVAP